MLHTVFAAWMEHSAASPQYGRSPGTLLLLETKVSKPLKKREFSHQLFAQSTNLEHAFFWQAVASFEKHAEQTVRLNFYKTYIQKDSKCSKR